MKLKLTITPSKEANGYYVRLPEAHTVGFTTIKNFEPWEKTAANQLNGIYKTCLINYQYLVELYVWFNSTPSNIALAFRKILDFTIRY